MKKILQHPITSVILVFAIVYLTLFYSYPISEFLLVTLPNKILGFKYTSVMSEDLLETWIFYFKYIDVWIVCFVIIIAFKRYRPVLKAFSPKLKGNNIKATLIGGLCLGAGLNLLIVLVPIAMGTIKIHYVGMGIGAFILLFVAVIVQAGSEELICRAFIYQNLRKLFSDKPQIAILGNGLFFMLVHVPIPGMSIYSLLLILLAAIIYSLMVYYFDSLWIPILAHTTWNFMQNIILGLPNSGMVFPVSMFKLDAQAKNFAYDPIFGIEGTLLAVIVYVIVCAGILYFGKKRGPKETNIWSDEKE